jgi:tetratricopeptide (TPR) repeat protein
MRSGSVYDRRVLPLKLLVAAATLLIAAANPWAQSGFTESARLSAAYDLILQARFADAHSAMERACPPAPREACVALETATLWWEILLDPNNRALDSRLQAAAATAIEAATEWTSREPRRAEAWFYLAGAHAPLVQWRVLRGHRLAAARDGKKIKDALERAIALDPAMHDAYFGIGLYHYYADVAPAALKALRWLLLLPGGDRRLGLEEILRARTQGTLLRGEADYQLHLLYLWYERKTDHALDLLQALAARHPSNPLFVQRIAEVHRDYRQDHAASLETWRTLLDRASANRVERAAMSVVRARIGAAESLVALSQPDRAIIMLAPVIETSPTAPYGAAALAQLILGRAYERLGVHEKARTALRAAIASAPADDPDDIRSRARVVLARVGARERATIRNF